MAGFFYTIILLGCVQGLVVGGLLFFSKQQRRPNRILAVLILLIALASFNLYGSYKNWFGSDLLQFASNFIPLVMVMPLGPLIYFYTQSLLDPGFRITKKEKRHFYPVLVDLIPSLTAIVFILGVSAHLFKNKPGPWASFIDDYNVYADIPRWMSVSFYVWMSSKYLSAFTQKKEGRLNGQATSFKWLEQFIKAFMVFQCIWLLYLIPYVIPKYTNWVLDTFAWYPIYIPMAVLIYWMGIRGYIVSQQQTFADKKSNEGSNALPPELVQQVSASLIKAMEQDKLFLDPALNVAAVAASTGFAQKTISAVLNQHLQKSFNEFVNGYRIAAFKEKILLPAFNHLTIAGIAMDCGFNSQATFQRVFKEMEGKSPGEWRKGVRE